MRILWIFWVFASGQLFGEVPDKIEVVDDSGRNVRLQAPAMRVVSLAPNLTEILFHLGVGDRIVGADEYSNDPPAAKSITRVNNHAAANFELILSLQPDLVVAWQSGNGARIIRRLRELGLPVFVVETRSIADIPSLYRRLGALVGMPKSAAAQADDFAERVSVLRNQYQQRTPVRLFYQIWRDPLMTVNGQHLISDVVALCGGRNIFHDAAPLVPSVGVEAVIAADPEVILSSGSAVGLTEWRSQWRQWEDISAVANNHLYLIPPDLMQRESPRLLEGAEYLCQYLDAARPTVKSQ